MTTTASAAARMEKGLLGNLPPTLEWQGDDDGFLRLLDQTRLPREVVMRDCHSIEEVWEAIKVLRVRGAPAIGVAAAYGLCLGLRSHRNEDAESFRIRLDERADYLCEARPTAVNLAWAVRRIQNVATETTFDSVQATWDAMLAEAHRMAQEDADTCRKIGEHGAELVPEGGTVITHCNAGALATVAYGTALSVLYVAHERGRRFQVFADETRPLLQGARLTAFELNAAGLNVTVLCDNAAGALMKTHGAQLAIVGADRIAANGDVANKIGTYGLAVMAQRHGVPFYVAAPVSTFDLTLKRGDEIPIEQRGQDEVRGGFGQDNVPPGVPCFNPAFDVTPAELVTGIVTERGIIKPVTAEQIRAVCGGPCS